MRGYPLGFGGSIGLLFALALVGACNTDPDVIAIPKDDAGAVAVQPLPRDAGSGPIGGGFAPPFPIDPPGCTAEAAERFDRLGQAYISLLHFCSLPISLLIADEGLRIPPPVTMPPPEGEPVACKANPLLFWVEPQLPLPPVRVRYCAESCRRLTQALFCSWLAHPCHEPADDQDAGAIADCPHP